MTAGIGTVRYRSRPRFVCLLVALATVRALLAGVSPVTGQRAATAQAAPVVRALPGWAEFQSDCVAGPSPGQGSTPRARRCWAAHLQAAAIVPDYAVDALNAAQAGGNGEAFMVLEDIGNVAIRGAAQGCGLYAQAASE